MTFDVSSRTRPEELSDKRWLELARETRERLQNHSLPDQLVCRLTSFAELVEDGEAYLIDPPMEADLRGLIAHRPLPAFFEGKFNNVVKICPSYFGIFANCTILGISAGVVLNDGRLLLDDMIYDVPRQDVEKYTRYILATRFIGRDEYAFVDIGGARKATYNAKCKLGYLVGGRRHHGHMLFDYFGTLSLRDQYEKYVGSLDFAQYLVGWDSRWQEVLFERAGVNKEQVQYFSKEHIVQCERCFIPSILRKRDQSPRRSVKFIRSLFPPNETGSDRTRIYISRADVANEKAQRKIANESELVRMLEHEFNVVSVQLGNLSPEEQIKLFSRAELVVGVFGNGFSNMVFSPADCVMIEFVAKNALCNMNLSIESGQCVIPIERKAGSVDLADLRGAIQSHFSKR